MRILLALLLCAALPAFAGTATLNNPINGLSCPYTSIAIDAGGNVTIHCGDIPPPQPPVVGPPTQPPTQPPAGCNPGSIQPQFAWGVLQARQSAGQVLAYPIPEPQFGRYVTFTQGQQPSTPPGAVTEFTVSTCPGVIDEGAGACYYRSTFVNYNVIDVYRSNPPPGVCQAPAGGTYYMNVRWTYPNCPFGACGFSLQWVSNW